MRTRDYRDPLRELRLAEARVANRIETRATRELRESVAAERSTVLYAPDGDRPARRSFRRERIPAERRRPGGPRYRTLAIPEPGSFRSELPAAYAIRRGARTVRAGFGESLRDA